SALKRTSSEFGPSFSITRSRRARNSACLSASVNSGAGGASRITGGAAARAGAGTKPVGSTRTKEQTHNSVKVAVLSFKSNNSLKNYLSEKQLTTETQRHGLWSHCLKAVSLCLCG